jgi:hypothetical protein
MGKRKIRALNEQTGEVVTLIADEVLIHEAFPFHILSEDKVFQKGCTAFKKHGSWQFRKPAGAPLFHASQRLATGGSGAGNSRLYFIDEQRPSQQASASVCMAVRDKPDKCVPEKAPMISPPKILAARSSSIHARLALNLERARMPRPRSCPRPRISICSCGSTALWVIAISRTSPLSSV